MPPTAPGELIDSEAAATPEEPGSLVGGGFGPVAITGPALITTGTYADESPNGTYLPTGTLVEGRPTYTAGGTWPIAGSGLEIAISYSPTTGWDIVAYDDGVSITNWDDGVLGGQATPVGVGFGNHSGGSGIPVCSAVALAAAAELIDGGTPATPDAPGELV